MRFALAIGLVGAIGVSGVAFGAFAIYNNGFGSKNRVKELKKIQGGKGCARDRLGKNRAGLTVRRGKHLCAWRLPVVSDRSGGDFVVQVHTELRKRSATKAKKRAFVWIGARNSKESGYQLRAYPTAHRWMVTRGLSGPRFPKKGKSRAVDGPGKRNTLRLSVVGTKIRAWINGELVVDGVEDPNAAEISGQHIWVGVGQGRKLKKKSAQFALKGLRVLVPPPGS